MDKAPPCSSPRLGKACSRASAGFSLVEVALAIGIVAFAFVAILGLLPVGMRTFRDSIDKTNEGRIMQVFNSRAQSTEFSKLEKELDFASSSKMFFFDEEGSFLDERKDGYEAMDATQKEKAIYAVKLFLEPGWATSSQATDSAALRGNTNAVNSRMLFVLLCPIRSAGFKQFNDDLTSLASVKTSLDGGGTSKLRTEVKLRSMLIPKMDGETL